LVETEYGKRWTIDWEEEKENEIVIEKYMPV
jgi:hypothetical protein